MSLLDSVFANKINKSINSIWILFLALLVASAPIILTVDARAAAPDSVHNIVTGENFSSIQAAIDDTNTLDGHTIKVDQGNTFEESLLINKELTIRSDNKWGTTIITQGAYRGIDIAANNVTLEGFKVLLNDSESTAWHLKISAQQNIVLRDIVMYGPGKNSGYVGNDGITGIDINSSQNILLDRVFVEMYTKNGIALTSKQSSTSTSTSNITFKDIISRNNGKSDGWAGVAFYTTSSQGQKANIDGVLFEGQPLVAWNPMGIFIEGSGGVISGNNLLELGESNFENNKYGLVNAQTADVIALDSVFDGKNGINTDKSTREYIENQIWHDCKNSPYLTGECDMSTSTPDLPSYLGSVKYAIDNQGPVVEGIVLNGKSVSAVDVRSANCEAIVSSYIIGGEIDLGAKITDVSVDVSSVKYKVRKVNSGGCTVSSIFSSGNVAMANTTDDSWEDLAGFDTNGVPEDGDYTIRLLSEDSLGNKTTSYVDIKVDNSAPLAIINSPLDGDVIRSSVDIRGTIEDINPLRYYLRVENSTGSVVYSKVYNNPASFNDQSIYTWDTSAFDDGEYTIYLEARDQADNKEGSRNNPGTSVNVVDVTVDNTAPIIGFDDLNTKDLSPEIIGTVDDDNAEVKVTIEGAEYTANVNSGYWTVPAGTINPDLVAGDYDITISAMDLAGNISVPVSGNLKISPLIMNSVNPPTRTSSVVVVTQPENQPINQPQPNSVNTGTTTSPTTDNNQATQVEGVQDEGSEGNTDVEGITSIGGEAGQENFASTASSNFNWWWLLALLGLVMLGYGIYRFATVEEED